MKFDENDPIQGLILYIYLCRDRGLLFSDFLKECTQSPAIIFNEFSRIITDRYTLVPFTPSTWHETNCTFINRHLLDLNRSAVPFVPYAHFTTMNVTEIEEYLSAFASRPIVGKLVCLRNVSDTPIKLSRQIDELGGEFMEMVCTTSPARELHRFVCSYMFDVQMMRCVTPCVIVALPVRNPEPETTVIKISPTKLPSSYFRCVAIFEDGSMCGKQAHIKCTKCHRAFFCSKRCKSRDAAMHASECDHMRKVKVKKGEALNLY